MVGSDGGGIEDAEREVDITVTPNLENTSPADQAHKRIYRDMTIS